jgi:hypothetical protein
LQDVTVRGTSSSSSQQHPAQWPSHGDGHSQLALAPPLLSPFNSCCLSLRLLRLSWSPPLRWAPRRCRRRRRSHRCRPPPPLLPPTPTASSATSTRRTATPAALPTRPARCRRRPRRAASTSRARRATPTASSTRARPPSSAYSNPTTSARPSTRYGISFRETSSVAHPNTSVGLPSAAICSCGD